MVATAPPAVPEARDAEVSRRELPTWFVIGFVTILVWCATAGALGVVLLTLGWYHAAVVGGLAAVAALCAAVMTGRRLGPRAPVDHRAAIAAVALALAFFALAGMFHSEHLLSDRDPAAYITVGRAIARDHELRPVLRTGVFATDEFGVPGERYNPGFFPMLPVLLAQGWSVGGDTGLLLVAPFLGSIGLLACFALAARVLGPRAALLAPLLLVVAPLQLWFARDAYSELVVQVVVLGGLWLFLEAHARGDWRVALLSGAIVATSALARVDSLAILVGVLLLIGLAWLRARESRAGRRVAGAFALTTVVGTAIALAITQHTADTYLGDLDNRYRQLLIALGLTAAAVVGVIVVQRLRPGLGRWLSRQRVLFVAVAVTSLALVAWAYLLRPDPISDLPAAAPGPPTLAYRRATQNWHFSRSLHWFTAYFGVVALAVAVAGMLLLAYRAWRGDTAAGAVVLVVVPVAVLYVAQPSIAPDQPWAMRRYLPVVLPGIAIAVAVALSAVWTAARRLAVPPIRRIATAAVALLAVLSIAPAAYAAGPFLQARMQHGAEAAVHGICATAGDDSAVLVFGYRYLDIELPSAIREFCGVPTAKSTTVDLQEVSREWQQAGRRLIVATAVPDAVIRKVPGAAIVGHYVVSDDDDPQRVFDRAPRHFRPIPTEIWLLQIPAAPS